MEGDERGHEKPAKSFLMSDCDLLRLILDELKAAREEVGRKEKFQHSRRLAEIIDRVFFVLYFSSSVIFMAFMYLAWIQKGI